MKKLMPAILALLLTLCLPAYAEISLTPVKEESLALRSSGLCYLLQDDGGYIAAGRLPRQNGVEDGVDIGAIYQVDGQGNERWRLEMSAGFSIFFRDMVPLSDGGIALLRTTEEHITGEDRKDVILIIRDGELISETLLTPGNDAIWVALHPARDGYFVFQGERKEKDSHGGTFHVPVLEKHLSDGSIAWRHVFDEHELYLSDVAEVDGGYLFYGSIEEQQTGNRINEGVAVRVAEDGEVQWITQVGDPGGGISFGSAAFTTDDGVLLAGTQVPTKQPQIGLLMNPAVACVGLDGTLRWQRVYDDLGVEASGFTALAATENGCLAVWRESDYRPPLHLVLLDGEGAVQETRTIDSEAARSAIGVWLKTVEDKLFLLFTEEQEGVAGESNPVRTFHAMEITQ